MTVTILEPGCSAYTKGHVDLREFAEAVLTDQGGVPDDEELRLAIEDCRYTVARVRPGQKGSGVDFWVDFDAKPGRGAFPATVWEGSPW